MFEQFFGLSENPFSLTPDPRFIYPSRTHDEALAHLKYWLEHKEGFAMITGEVGTGKTTALFRLIDGLERRYEIAFLTNSTLSPVELLEDACRKFGIDVDTGVTKPGLLQKLENYLRRQGERQSGTLLIIDEAQNFDHTLLEEVRLLSNIAKPGGPPMLQIALVGQPELERKLGSAELRQLKQRIGVHYRIEPLSHEETLQYVHHRVSVANGFPRVLFPEDTVRILYERTHGLPREINQLASQSLLGAYVEDSTTVRPEHILGAIREMNFRSVLDGAERTGSAVSAAMSAPPLAPARPASVRPAAPAPPAPRAANPVATGPMVTPRPGPAAVPPAPTPTIVPATTAPMAAVPHAATSPSRPTMVPPRVETAPAVAPPRRAAARTPQNFGAVPSLSMPKSTGEGLQKGGGWRRIGLVLVALGIVGVAAMLLLMPQKEPVDELDQLESEQTIPTVPQSPALGAPIGSVPSPSQSADASGTTGAASARESAPVDVTTPAGSATTGTAPSGTATNGTPPVGAGMTGSSMDAPTSTPVSTPPPGSPGDQAAAPPPAIANGYRLQVASLRDSLNAVSMGRDLAGKTGLVYEIVRDRKGEVTWFALNLGSFESDEAARAARTDLGTRFGVFNEAIVRTPRRR